MAGGSDYSFTKKDSDVGAPLHVREYLVTKSVRDYLRGTRPKAWLRCSSQCGSALGDVLYYSKLPGPRPADAVAILAQRRHQCDSGR